MAVHAIETGYDVDYDLHLDRWCLHYSGEIICLTEGIDFDGAMKEAEVLVDSYWS